LGEEKAIKEKEKRKKAKGQHQRINIRRSLEEDISPSLTRPALKENWGKSESYLCLRRLE